MQKSHITRQCFTKIVRVNACVNVLVPPPYIHAVSLTQGMMPDTHTDTATATATATATDNIATHTYTVTDTAIHTALSAPPLHFVCLSVCRSVSLTRTSRGKEGNSLQRTNTHTHTICLSICLSTCLFFCLSLSLCFFCLPCTQEKKGKALQRTKCVAIAARCNALALQRTNTHTHTHNLSVYLSACLSLSLSLSISVSTSLLHTFRREASSALQRTRTHTHNLSANLSVCPSTSASLSPAYAHLLQRSRQ